MARTVEITDVKRAFDTYYVEGLVEGNPYQITVARSELDGIGGQENKIMFAVNRLAKADTDRRASQYGPFLVTRTVDP